MWRKDGTKGLCLNNACEVLYLGVSNEGNANREFSLHATRECFGASMSLVFKVQDTDDPVHFIWNLVFRVAFQLDMRQKVTLCTNGTYSHPNYQHQFHINVNGEPGIKCLQPFCSEKFCVSEEVGKYS